MTQGHQEKLDPILGFFYDLIRDILHSVPSTFCSILFSKHKETFIDA